MEPSSSACAGARNSEDSNNDIQRAAVARAAAMRGDQAEPLSTPLLAPAIGLLAAVGVAVVGLSLTGMPGLSPSADQDAKVATAVVALDTSKVRPAMVRTTMVRSTVVVRPTVATEYAALQPANVAPVLAGIERPEAGLARPITPTLPAMVFSRHAIEPAVASLKAPLTLPVALIASDTGDAVELTETWVSSVDARSMSEIALDLAEIAPAAAPADGGIQRISDNRGNSQALASFVVYEWGMGGDAPRNLAPASRVAERVIDGPTTQTVEALSAHFEEIDYDLETLLDEPNQVPRIFVAQLPKDLADAETVQLRKAVFIKSVLPVVLRVNEDILLERRRLLRVRKHLSAGLALDAVDSEWLDVLTERYEAAPGDIDALMRRVDVIPASLALAQAAEESGWGTSRFAREGNALFGQYTYKKSKGILPSDRSDGRRHKIRAYANLLETVRAYMHNLNYHRAYGDFRAKRAEMRDADDTIDGHALAGELRRYSERGAAYVRTIRGIIRYNNFDALDHARLIDRQWTRAEDADDRDQPS